LHIEVSDTPSKISLDLYKEKVSYFRHLFYPINRYDLRATEANKMILALNNRFML